MAGVVFEKQLQDIRKGVALLDTMLESMGELNKLGANFQMKKGIQGLQEANKELNTTAERIKVINDRGLTKVIKDTNKFNTGLQKTKKALSAIYSKMKMISFAGMAGIGALTAIGAGMGSSATKKIASSYTGNTLNLGKRQMDIYSHLGKKETGNEGFFLDMINTIRSMEGTSEGNKALATLGINQQEFLKKTNLGKIEALIEAAHDVSKKGANNDVFNEALQALSGKSYNELTPLKNINKKYNEISKKTNKESVYSNVKDVGDGFTDLQYNLGQFNDWFVSNFSDSLKTTFNAIQKSFNTLKDNEAFQNAITAGAQWVGANLPILIGKVMETIANIPNHFEAIRNLLDKIYLAVKSVKDSIYYVFTDLGDKLSQVEWDLGITKVNPFSTLKPSDKSLTSMYADKYANIQAAMDIAHRDIKILESKKKNAIAFSSLTGDTQKSNEIQSEITSKKQALEELIKEKNNLLQQATTNNITIYIDKNGDVEAKSESNGVATKMLANIFTR